MTSTARVAAVTGAAQGISRRTAEVLADRGYTLALIDLRESTETVGAVHERGREALDVPGDVSVEADVAAFAEQVRERFGRVDVLVNNAGISLITPAEDTGAEQWRRVLAVNLTGPFLLCQAFGRMMLEAGVGSVINVASIAGLAGVADRAAYKASKHGLVGLTRTLAAEWGGRGVRVNAVCPGWVKTEMDVADQAAGGYVDTDIVEQVPMGRFAAPDDIAEAIAFLADPAASGFVNGVTVPIDGGWTADASWTQPASAQTLISVRLSPVERPRLDEIDGLGDRREPTFVASLEPREDLLDVRNDALLVPLDHLAGEPHRSHPRWPQAARTR